MRSEDAKPSPDPQDPWHFPPEEPAPQEEADLPGTESSGQGMAYAGKLESLSGWIIGGVFGLLIVIAVVWLGTAFWELFFQDLPAAEETLREFFACMARDDLQAAARYASGNRSELTPEYLEKLKNGPHTRLFRQVPQLHIDWGSIVQRTLNGEEKGLRVMADLEYPDGSRGYCHAVLLKRGEQWRICQLSPWPHPPVPHIKGRPEDVARIAAALHGLCKALARGRRELIPLFLATYDPDLPPGLQPMEAASVPGFDSPTPSPLRSLQLRGLSFRRQRLRRSHRQEGEPRYRIVVTANVYGQVELENGQRYAFRARLLAEGLWGVCHFRLAAP